MTMRKIESQMLTAIARRKNFRSNNTEVRVNDDNTIEVFLHGNKIASFNYMGDGEVMWLYWGSRYHFSRTTFSRQNALLRQFVGGGVGVYTKDWEPYLMRRYGLGPMELSTGDKYSFSV